MSGVSNPCGRRERRRAEAGESKARTGMEQGRRKKMIREVIRLESWPVEMETPEFPGFGSGIDERLRP